MYVKKICFTNLYFDKFNAKYKVTLDTEMKLTLNLCLGY